MPISAAAATAAANVAAASSVAATATPAAASCGRPPQLLPPRAPNSAAHTGGVVSPPSSMMQRQHSHGLARTERSPVLAPESYVPPIRPPEITSGPRVITYLERTEQLEAAARLAAVQSAAGSGSSAAAASSSSSSARRSSDRPGASAAVLVKGALPRMVVPAKCFDNSGDPRLSILNSAPSARAQCDLEVFYEYSRSMPFFAGLHKNAHMSILERCRLVQIPAKHTVVYLEGDEPTSMYVVLQGSLGMYSEPHDVRPGFYLNYSRVEPREVIARGMSVGEKELISAEEDTATAAAAAATTSAATAAVSSSSFILRRQRTRDFSAVSLDNNVSLLEISRSDFLQLRASSRSTLLADIVAFLGGCAIFRHWEPQALAEVAAFFQRRSFRETPAERAANAAAQRAAMQPGGSGITASLHAHSQRLPSDSAVVGVHSPSGLIAGETLDDIDQHVLFVMDGSALVIRRSESQRISSQRALTSKQKLAKFNRKRMKKLVAESKEREAQKLMLQSAGSHFRKFSKLDADESGGNDSPAAAGSTPGSSNAASTPPAAGHGHARRPSFMVGGGGGHSRGTSLMGGGATPLSPPGVSAALQQAGSNASTTNLMHALGQLPSAAGGPPAGARGHARRTSFSLFQQNETRKKHMLEALEARKSGAKDGVESSSDEEADSEDEEEEATLIAEAEAQQQQRRQTVDESTLSPEELVKHRAALASAPPVDARETFVDAWVVARLKCGDMFGVSSLERPQTFYTRNVFLRTAEPMTALLIARKDFEFHVLHSTRHVAAAQHTRKILAMMAHFRNALLKSPLKRSPSELHTMLACLHWQHSAGPHPLLSSLTDRGREWLLNACKVEVVRKHRILVMPNELADHLYIILSGSVSLFADSYESEEQILLCTLGRGQHVGELSLLFHNRSVSMKDVQTEVTRVVNAQDALEAEKKGGRKRRKKEAGRVRAASPSSPQHAMVPHAAAAVSSPKATPSSPGGASSPVAAGGPAAAAAAANAAHKARSYGITAVTNGCATFLKLEKSHALYLLSARCGWTPQTLHTFLFLRGLNLFTRLNFTRLLQLVYASRFLTFGAHETLECQGERPGPSAGGGGLWILVKGEAEVMREIGVGMQASVNQAASKKQAQAQAQAKQQAEAPQPAGSDLDAKSKKAKRSAASAAAAGTSGPSQSASSSLHVERESFVDSLASSLANQHLKPIVINQLLSGDHWGEQCLELGSSSSAAAASTMDADGFVFEHEPRTSYVTVASTSKVDVLFLSAHVLQSLLPKQILKFLRHSYAERLRFRQSRVRSVLLNSFPPSARVYELKHSMRQKTQLLRSLPMFATATGSHTHHSHAQGPGSVPGGPHAYSNINNFLSPEDSADAFATMGRDPTAMAAASASATAAAAAASAATAPSGGGTIPSASAAAASLAATGLAPEFTKTTSSTLSANVSKVIGPDGRLRVGLLYGAAATTPAAAEIASPTTSAAAPSPTSQVFVDNPFRSAALLVSSAETSTEDRAASKLPNYKELLARLESLPDEPAASPDQPPLRALLKGYLELGPLDAIDGVLSTSAADVEESESLALDSDDWRPRDKVPRSMFALTAQRGDISKMWGPRKKWLFAFNCIRKKLAVSWMLSRGLRVAAQAAEARAAEAAAAAATAAAAAAKERAESSSGAPPKSPDESSTNSPLLLPATLLLHPSPPSPLRIGVASAGPVRRMHESKPHDSKFLLSPTHGSLRDRSASATVSAQPPHGSLRPRSAMVVLDGPSSAAGSTVDSPRLGAASPVLHVTLSDHTAPPSGTSSPVPSALGAIVHGAHHAHPRDVVANRVAVEAQIRARERVRKEHLLAAAHYRSAERQQNSFLNRIQLPECRPSSRSISPDTRSAGTSAAGASTDPGPITTTGEDEDVDADEAADTVKDKSSSPTGSSSSSSSEEDEDKEKAAATDASISFFLTALQSNEGDTVPVAPSADATTAKSQALVLHRHNRTPSTKADMLSAQFRHGAAVEMPKLDPPRAAPPQQPPTNPMRPLPWSTAASSVGGHHSTPHKAGRPVSAEGLIDLAVGSIDSPRGALTVQSSDASTKSGFSSDALVPFNVYAERDTLILPPPPGTIDQPGVGTTPHAAVKPSVRRQTRARNRLQNRDKHGRPLGPLPSEELWSRAATGGGVADVLSSVPAHLRDLNSRLSAHSPKQQQLLSNVLSAGKSIHKLTEAGAEALLSNSYSRGTAGGPIVSGSSGSSFQGRNALPSDDMEFHQRQQMLLGGTVHGAFGGDQLVAGGGAGGASGGALNKAAAKLAAEGASPAEIAAATEKSVAEGLSALRSFAHVWLGRALPYKDAAIHTPRRIITHNPHEDESASSKAPDAPLTVRSATAAGMEPAAAAALAWEEERTRYLYVPVTAGFNPLSAPAVPNQSSSAAALAAEKASFQMAPAVGATVGSFSSGVLSDTQASNRRARSRSPPKAVALAAAIAAAVAASPTQSSTITIANPLAKPAGYEGGAASMDVDFEALQRREEAFAAELAARAPNAGGPERLEEKEQDYIPRPLNWAVDERPVQHLGDDGQPRAGSEQRDWTTLPVPKYVAPNPPPPVMRRAASIRQAAEPVVAKQAVPAATVATLAEPVRTAASLQSTARAPVPRAAAIEASRPSELVVEVASHLKTVEPAEEKDHVSAAGADNDLASARFKTVELLPAVVASRAFRVKALVGNLAVRLDLGAYFHNLFRRSFGFHAELERVFVSPLTGFLYAQYQPGRLPAAHVESVVREALVAAGHVSADVTGISVAMMKDETFRCLYNLSETRAPTKMQMTHAHLAIAGGLKTDGGGSSILDAELVGARPLGVGVPPAVATVAAAAPLSRNLQPLLHTSMPIMSGRSTLVDDLASQLLSPKPVLGSASGGASLDLEGTAQLYPLKDPLNYHGLAHTFTNKRAWVSPYIAATSAPNAAQASILQGVQRAQVPFAANNKKQHAPGSPALVAPRSSKSASGSRRLRKESPAQLLSHASGFMSGPHYQEVAAVLDSMAEAQQRLATAADAAAAVPNLPLQTTHYSYTTHASIAAQHAPTLDTPVCYAQLSSRLPARPASSQAPQAPGRGGRRGDRVGSAGGAVASASWASTSVTPLRSYSRGSQSARGSGAGEISSAWSAPSSARGSMRVAAAAAATDASSPVTPRPPSGLNRLPGGSRCESGFSPAGASAVKQTTFAFGSAS